jgi:hypothetical protein
MNTNDSKDHLYLYGVWVFNGGVKSTFSGGVFSKKELAEDWIKKNALTGTLTRYALDMGVYEWAISNGAFNPKRDNQKTPSFIGRFSSASQEHYHYEDGKEA